jgi:hypothetical protein
MNIANTTTLYNPDLKNLSIPAMKFGNEKSRNFAKIYAEACKIMMTTAYTQNWKKWNFICDKKTISNEDYTLVYQPQKDVIHYKNDVINLIILGNKHTVTQEELESYKDIIRYIEHISIISHMWDVDTEYCKEQVLKYGFVKEFLYDFYDMCFIRSSLYYERSRFIMSFHIRGFYEPSHGEIMSPLCLYMFIYDINSYTGYIDFVMDSDKENIIPDD